MLPGSRLLLIADVVKLSGYVEIAFINHRGFFFLLLLDKHLDIMARETVPRHHRFHSASQHGEIFPGGI